MRGQVTSPQEKPALDEGTFQQLLAAAYTLQEQTSRQLVKEAKLDYTQTPSEQAIAEHQEPIKSVQATPDAVVHPAALELVLPLVQPESDDQRPVTVAVALEQQEIGPDAVRQAPQLAAVAVAREIAVEQQQSPAYTAEATEEEVLEPTQSQSGQAHLRRPLHRHKTAGKRFLLTDELFWNVATVLALAAVLTLLLGASFHRFSPFPAGLSLEYRK